MVSVCILKRKLGNLPKRFRLSKFHLIKSRLTTFAFAHAFSTSTNTSVMDCLPTLSLPAFLTNCVQSLGFYHNSNDSFWSGEEGQRPNKDFDREIPSTTTLHARSESEGMVYTPDPAYLIDHPKQTRFEANSFSSHVRPALGKLMTDWNGWTHY